ncbi:hypothetical protein HHI36_016898 [Cryptolaemus montrouzieri]|uniref:Leucine-rich PPR motif-containing protein, mitochondrial n=1 Tax=Cryptolaemus montrouzieri TaxID=559131 RepID=A0ABD2NL37_9CUCU
MNNYRILCQKLYVPNVKIGYLYRKLVGKRIIVPKCEICPQVSQFSTARTKVVSQKDNISTFNELVHYVRNARRVEMEHIANILNKVENDNLTEEQVLFLLQWCRRILPGETQKTKHILCQNVFQTFQSQSKFSEKVYQTYVNVCTENRHLLDIETLLSSLPKNVSLDTIKLMLRNVCEGGDTEKAQTVLLHMKNKGCPVDEEVFNDLILCHTINGGLRAGETVLKSMHMAKLSESDSTRFFILKGLAKRHDFKEFIEGITKYSLHLSEKMLLDLLYTLGFSGNHEWSNYAINLFDRNSVNRCFQDELEKLCLNLIHNERFDAAMTFYELLVAPKPDIRYGGMILREMLISSAPIEKIVEFANELKDREFNEYALEDVTNLALKYKLTRSAMHLFKHFQVLRPHYFWPVLIRAHINGGEKGLMETVQNVDNMNVRFDSESFQDYIFPYCDLSDPGRVMKNFQKHGYSIRALLTPLIVALLKKRQTKLALKIYNEYDVQIGTKELMDVLPHTWIMTVDHDVCLSLLQRICESQNENLFKNFLITILSKLSNSERLGHFLQLLKDSKKRKFSIDTTTAVFSINILKKNFASCKLFSEIEDAINDLLQFMDTTDVPYILHPRDMNTEQLECHFIELKAKQMETRGVIRKLIQKHTSEGNFGRVKELEDELMIKQYSASPGIKASIMYTYIKEENISKALKTYYELKENFCNFKIDDFKIIDLAALLVKNKDFDTAVDILLNEAKGRKLQTKKSLEKNCRTLLFSIEDIEQQRKMFDILIDNGYCLPSNVILGCLIQLHIEKDHLKDAVDMFIDFCQKYRKTPMQLVLIGKLLESGNQKLLQSVLDAVVSIYGDLETNASLISAHCEKGFKEKLAILLKNIQSNPVKEMEKRCERWVQLGQLEPLQVLFEVSRDVSPKLLNKSKIQQCIMQIYCNKNDCDGALEFWKTLIDNEDLINPEIEAKLSNLLERCKYQMPEYLDFRYSLK